MPRRYLLAGLLACGVCGGGGIAWSNGKPAYRCRHGHTSAMARPARPKNTYIREDKLLPHLAALHLAHQPGRRARTAAESGDGPVAAAC